MTSPRLDLNARLYAARAGLSLDENLASNSEFLQLGFWFVSCHLRAGCHILHHHQHHQVPSSQTCFLSTAFACSLQRWSGNSGRKWAPWGLSQPPAMGRDGEPWATHREKGNCFCAHSLSLPVYQEGWLRTESFKRVLLGKNLPVALWGLCRLPATGDPSHFWCPGSPDSTTGLTACRQTAWIWVPVLHQSPHLKNGSKEYRALVKIKWVHVIYAM